MEKYMATQEMTEPLSETESPGNMDDAEDNTDNEETLETTAEKKDVDIASDTTDDENCEVEKKEEEIAVNISNLLQVGLFLYILYN